MKLSSDKLQPHLGKHLAPIYVVTGDEPLLVGEAADAIRATARASGASEREVLHVESGFDWGQLRAAGESLSLFAERRIIELRLGSARIGEAGGRALEDYAARAPEDVTLLVTCGKLDGRAQRARWVRALEQAGVLVTVWPVKADRLAGWLRGRMRSRGLQPTPGAVEGLAARVEGNLLAASQEIDKLVLLQGPGEVDVTAVERAAADSARFSVYDLVDAAVDGDAPRAVRILHTLREEGEALTLVLWALTRELRQLATLAGEVGTGKRVEAVMARHGVWERRQPRVRRALARGSGPGHWRALIAQAARVDRVVKGVGQGRPWEELLQLVLQLAGRPLWAPVSAADAENAIG